jgi:heme/copper-type cytochrome/quinol oxidase subunit 2
MLSIRAEVAGIVLVLATLVGIPLWALREESRANEIPEGEDLHVITLTAVADGGIFTFEDVVGHNYWRRQPKVARPVVRVGETILFRLKSADVTHGFSIPELAVGPIYIEPGYVTEVRFEPEESGEYLIQCSTRCGCCHEEMFAILEVRGPNGEPPPEDMRFELPPRTMCPLKKHRH